MTLLSVVDRGEGVLVVDSRLIAEQLGIEHRALLQTIDKYLERLERKAKIAFEMSKSQRGKPERFAWLNEQQASLLMTFSRNTEQVLDCKEALVEAFEQAKRIIKEVLPAQSEEIERLRLQNENLRLQADIEKTKRDRETTFFAVTATMGEEAGRRVMAEARGEQPIQIAPAKPEVVFIEQGTDQVVGSTANGRTITALLKDTGHNPNSKKDVTKAKQRLKSIGIDYETGSGLEEAAYLRRHFVISEDKYEEARRILTQDCAAANLFVWGMQQRALGGKTTGQKLGEVKQ